MESQNTLLLQLASEELWTHETVKGGSTLSLDTRDGSVQMFLVLSGERVQDTLPSREHVRNSLRPRVFPEITSTTTLGKDRTSGFEDQSDKLTLQGLELV